MVLSEKLVESPKAGKVVRLTVEKLSYWKEVHARNWSAKVDGMLEVGRKRIEVGAVKERTREFVVVILERVDQGPPVVMRGELSCHRPVVPLARDVMMIPGVLGKPRDASGSVKLVLRRVERDWIEYVVK